jgi:formylglycine-generating enzyme required for sulfatase activity
MRYTVQIGDTCSEIAERFGISVRALADLNHLPSDCGVIYAGQVLWAPAPDPQFVPTLTPTPIRPVATTVSEVDGAVLLYVPSGEFAMGTLADDLSGGDEEKPQHDVYLKAYWIDRTEVTNAMYGRCVQVGLCRPPAQTDSATRPAYFDEAEFAAYPVVYVAWQDAVDYCQWAGRRLPSEAEWEKAARGVDARPYPWGEAAPDLNRANFGGRLGDTAPVGSYPAGASPFGALDMAGNVAEWTADWFSKAAYSLSQYSNPSGPATGEFRVLRGGSWFNQASALRASFRLWNYPDLRSNTIGFRCAK